MRAYAALALLVVLATSATAASSARITARLATKPTNPAAGAAWTARIRLTSGGRPLMRARATLTARSGARSRAGRLRETRTRGLYTTRVVFPTAGRWALVVRVRGRSLPLGAVTVAPPRPDVRGPFGLAVAPDGRVAIADRDAGRVIVVNPRTGVARVAAATLDDPIAVAYDRAGALYANSGERIMRLDAGGPAVIAGTGVRGHSGDGGPATAARLGGVGSFSFGAGGELYVPEYDNWIRRVTPNGIIETVAGTGTEGYGGDGGPARVAAIAAPHALAVTTDGSVIFADSHNGRVRRIDGNGVITTLASGLSAPLSIAAVPDGSVVVGDAQTGLLQQIWPRPDPRHRIGRAPAERHRRQCAFRRLLLRVRRRPGPRPRRRDPPDHDARALATRRTRRSRPRSRSARRAGP